MAAEVKGKKIWEGFTLEHVFHCTEYAAVGYQANSSHAVRLLNFSVEHLAF
jgi:hypothetical protein